MAQQKAKAPHIKKIHDKIVDEAYAKGHSNMLLGILSKMCMKKLKDYSDYIDLLKREEDEAKKT